MFAINVLAPYLLTALVPAPERLVYLSSGMHFGGDPDLTDLQWERRRWNGAQAYSDSKLWDTMLAFAVARRWPRGSLQRGRARVGGDEDGRRRRARRSRGRGGHAVVAGGQRRFRLRSSAAATSTTSASASPAPTPAAWTLQEGLLERCAAITGVQLP